MNLSKIFKAQRKVSSDEIKAEIDSCIDRKNSLAVKLEEVKAALQNKRVDLMCGESVKTEIKRLEAEELELKNEIQTLGLVLDRLNEKFNEAFAVETQSRLGEIDKELAGLKDLSAEYRKEYLKYSAMADAYKHLILHGQAGNMLGQPSQTISYTGYEKKDYYTPFFDDALKGKEAINPQRQALIEERKTLKARL